MTQHPESAQKIIACYERMVASSTAMLSAARAGDWPAVVLGNRECEAIVAELRALQVKGMTQEFNQQKIALIRQVLANDAELRHLAEPRMKHLELVLHAPANNRRLAKAYGAMKVFD